MHMFGCPSSRSQSPISYVTYAKKEYKVPYHVHGTLLWWLSLMWHMHAVPCGGLLQLPREVIHCHLQTLDFSAVCACLLPKLLLAALQFGL